MDKTSAEKIWVNILNPSLESCEDHDCKDIISWADGSQIDPGMAF